MRAELETHLKLLQREGKIAMWTDRKIMPGAEWSSEIDRQRDEADMILLLVSADILTSDFCWEKEMQPAMKRHDAREATVVPIILRDGDWQSAPFLLVSKLRLATV